MFVQGNKRFGGLVAALTIASVALYACSGTGGQPATSSNLATQSLAQTPAAAVPASLERMAGAAPAAEDVPDAISNPRMEDYCRQSGGIVEVRRAVYGTNNPNPLVLAGKREFCQFTSSDKSRIHILLTTLFTTQPTLAALAYTLAPKMGSCAGNPASCYCTLLGGSDQFGGTSLAGGGWYKQDAIDQVLEACIFPDMSSIDSWGLAYHSAGIIRGTDLTKVMRYKYPGG